MERVQQRFSKRNNEALRALGANKFEADHTGTRKSQLHGAEYRWIDGEDETSDEVLFVIEGKEFSATFRFAVRGRPVKLHP